MFIRKNDQVGATRMPLEAFETREVPYPVSRSWIIRTLKPTASLPLKIGSPKKKPGLSTPTIQFSGAMSCYLLVVGSVVFVFDFSKKTIALK